MATTQDFIDKNFAKLEAQLDDWRVKVDQLLVKALVAREEAEIRSRKQLDELKQELDVARTRLDEAKVAGASRWESFKEGLENTWRELERTFKQLTA